MNTDVIVALYTQYQVLNFWMSTTAIVAVISFLIALISILIWGIDGFSWDGNLGSLIRIILSLFITLVFVVSTVSAIYISYQYEVVFKPSVARLVVPIGIDALDKVSVQVQDMWNLLKGLISK